MRVVYRIQSIIADFCPSLFLDGKFPLPYFVGFFLHPPSSAVPMSSTKACTFVGTQIPLQPLFIIIIIIITIIIIIIIIIITFIIIRGDTGKSKL